MATTKENKTISQFKPSLAGGGARPNLFVVEMTLSELGFDLPTFDADKFQFMCKAAQLPAQNIGSIDVPFRGRTFKVAGDRTIDAWTVTVINDEDFKIRNAMEEWSNRINRLERNVRDIGRYKTNATVIQYAKDGTPIREYKFDGIFPQVVSPIELDWATVDQIESFQVTFSYDYWTVSGGTTSDAGGR